MIAHLDHQLWLNVRPHCIASKSLLKPASAWRNIAQPGVVAAIRKMGHEVYDFRHPAEGDNGFHWSEIDGGWQQWDAGQYVKALDHPIEDATYTFRRPCNRDG